jgi:maltooligosyltrehalose trehalohydrolase
LLGANYHEDGSCQFCVWAPRASRVDVHVVSPVDRLIPLESTSGGYFQARVEAIAPGTRYLYRLNAATDRPDPASRFQPDGVHGPSEIVDSKFAWHDSMWRGIPLRDYIIYELHVGTFTAEGTLDAAAAKLDDLQSLGVTAVELMPVAQFPGGRDWGYDGTYLFAVQNSYGGPQALKRFADACHARNLAVVLDVVYNHLGPEGNYLSEFGPYFTGRYHTPWGEAVNFDGAYSDEVRRFLIENASQWLTDFHVDALRLDAIHAIVDTSATPFLRELGEAVHELGEQLNRRVFVIPESDLGDSRVATLPELGGHGLDAQWTDDFHHALHTLLIPEATGYYRDFGTAEALAEAFRGGYVYQGQHSAYRKRRHGNSTRQLKAEQFVVFAQNHDQVGNRLGGDRLAAIVSFEQLKVAAAAVLLSPFVPLLFMGEEYGETAPFLFFVSYSDPRVIEATRKGRRDEFSAFEWDGEIPDPQDEKTFLRSKLHPERHDREPNRALFEFYRELIRLRKSDPVLRNLSKECLRVRSWEVERLLLVRRWKGEDQGALILNFNRQQVSMQFELPVGGWRKRIDSAESGWSGPGSSTPANFDCTGNVQLTISPHSAVMFSHSPKARC